MLSWDFLLNKLAVSFYTELFMQFTGLLVVFTYLTGDKKTKPMGYLALLAIASVGQSWITDYAILSIRNSSAGRTIERISIDIYLVIEVTCCLSFIRFHLQSMKHKKILLFVNVLFTTCVIIHRSLNPYPTIDNWHIMTLENILIIFGTFFYFFDLFNYDYKMGLARTPSLCAISGMAILFCATTPFFLFFDYLRKNHSQFANSLYAINNISYSLLFITFIIAILFDKRQLSKAAN